MSEKGLILLDANFVKSFSRESEILKFDHMVQTLGTGDAAEVRRDSPRLEVP
jgi:hypothetical protein